ncbi:acetyltransferase [Vibrio cholerae]|nr:acetyltransferase [Vibrio cholerae]
MVTAVVVEFVVMRCQPLRRALCVLREVKCNILINCLK